VDYGERGLRGLPAATYHRGMAETQRESVPRNDDGELDTTLAFLTFARHCVIKKTEGLDDEQLRRQLVDSGTTLLGLVAHLTTAELYWFGYHVAGAAEEDLAPWDFGMAVPAGLGSDEVIQAYRNAITDSDALVRRLGDPAARVARPVDGSELTLRWVIAHMTSETVRHAGHADILREQIDGTTGR
jgi:uncharacterized damage-inducible protein DinB